MNYFKEELDYINSSEFKLGEYIYMGMGLTSQGGLQKVCMSVGYKIDYAFKKAYQFERLCESHVSFCSINKVKIGALTKCKEFLVTQEMKESYELQDTLELKF
ncbi:hypothetical protein [Winogradskyella sp. A2]|uniref:hypothetical protein n=1 Tax=Winogradskyella sp. A2 TaxID=3366944 RepID=UPI00398C7516